MEKACPDLCALKCVRGCNVFLPLFPGTQKSTAYVSDSQRMLRHFSPDREVFRGGPPETSSKLSNSSHRHPSRTKQSGQALNERQTASRLGPALRE